IGRLSEPAHVAEAAKSAPEERFEEIAEIVGRWAGGLPPASETAEAAAHAFPARRRREVLAVAPVRSKQIVFLALLRIAQDFIGLAQLFELVLGIRGFVDIGVQFAGEVAIR